MLYVKGFCGTYQYNTKNYKIYSIGIMSKIVK